MINLLMVLVNNCGFRRCFKEGSKTRVCWERCGEVEVEVTQSCLTLCNPMSMEFPGQKTGLGSLSYLQGSSHPRDQTQVSHITGRFFTCWAIREAQKYWSGEPIPSQGDLTDSGIEPVSPALQADSLATELWGKPGEVNENKVIQLISVQFSSVAQSCPTLCDPMNRNIRAICYTLLYILNLSSVGLNDHLKYWEGIISKN